MEIFAKTVALVGALALLFVASLIGGTFLWLIWPVAIPAAFPGLVASGVLAAKLSWWVAVCLTWLFGLLIKSSTTVQKKEE